MNGASPLGALGELTDRAWLVGGALRDELLQRETRDFDVAAEGDVRGLARDLGRATDAHSFALSEAFGAWRVIARDRSWQVDLTPVMGGTLEGDLARRDLTVNAMARPVGAGQLIDPYGGLDDLRARRLRMVGRLAFHEDPLRVMRLSRLATELDFTIDPDTQTAAISEASGLAGVAGERVFAELRQILTGERPAAGLRSLEATGAGAVVLPELEALHGIQQSAYHHLDAHDHTLEVIDRVVELASDPGARFPDLEEGSGRCWTSLWPIS